MLILLAFLFAAIILFGGGWLMGNAILAICDLFTDWKEDDGTPADPGDNP